MRRPVSERGESLLSETSILNLIGAIKFKLMIVKTSDIVTHTLALIVSIKYMHYESTLIFVELNVNIQNYHIRFFWTPKNPKLSYTIPVDSLRIC